MTDSPDYVEFGGLGSAPGPLQCDDTTLYVFGLQADHAKLDALCRRVFDDAHRRRRRLPPARRPGASSPSASSARSARRWSRGTRWAPCASRRSASGSRSRASSTTGDKLVGQDFGMFCAAMMLDNPISLLSGREDYGYPKTMGWSSCPPTSDPAAPLTLDVFGMNFGGGEAPERRRLMELTPVGDELCEAELAIGDIHEVGQWLKDLLFDQPQVDLGLHFAYRVRQGAARDKVNQVFLKQIRATDRRPPRRHPAGRRRARDHQEHQGDPAAPRLRLRDPAPRQPPAVRGAGHRRAAARHARAAHALRLPHPGGAGALERAADDERLTAPRPRGARAKTATAPAASTAAPTCSAAW